MPAALHDRALQELSFIRRTMEGAAAFTDVPGWGLVGMGTLAFLAAPVADRQPSPERWLLVWIATSAMAVLVGALAMRRKMQRRVAATGATLLTVPARRFLLSFWPALAAGGLLTVALVDPTTPGVDVRTAQHLLPGLWLTLYGVGITTAGAHSVRPVPLLGLAFGATGALTLLWPGAPGNLMMLFGFGALQVGFGLYIARRHGG